MRARPFRVTVAILRIAWPPGYFCSPHSTFLVAAYPCSFGEDAAMTRASLASICRNNRYHLRSLNGNFVMWGRKEWNDEGGNSIWVGNGACYVRLIHNHRGSSPDNSTDSSTMRPNCPNLSAMQDLLF
jgi:hypothetical protein